ncbi:hypothetical protein RRG08_017525 [Elysia crispata]|uniref:Uncharacterized protein n=1 Tax=Elysia crispata TaxID=231223 RepID=A0AAE0Y081_9GAST|nr:hypothetical protein RRG08_017525 [Elysia crispata]
MALQDIALAKQGLSTALTDSSTGSDPSRSTALTDSSTGSDPRYAKGTKLPSYDSLSTALTDSSTGSDPSRSTALTDSSTGSDPSYAKGTKLTFQTRFTVFKSLTHPKVMENLFYPGVFVCSFTASFLNT